MKRLMFAALGALALSGCMGTHLKKLPVCNGKHRRAANVYGSILPTLPVPVPPSEGGAVFSDPPAAVPSAHRVSPHKTSLREQPTQFASC